MSHSTVATERTLLIREIARLIEDAKASGKPIRAAYHAGMLAMRFPDANLPLGVIIEEITSVAKAAGVAIEAPGRT
jgi:hypothetical protein